MNDWLDNFQMMGIKLSAGEKSLMKMAMTKDRERIVKQIDEWLADEAERLGTTYIEIWTPNFSDQLKQLIKGETK